MVKIALTAKMRSGKDVAAEYLDNKYGFVRFAFGDELKREFHKAYPHIPKDPKPVRGYQLYGQLMRYVEDSEIWINRCFDHIRYINRVADDYNIVHADIPFMPVITDLRQPDEYERCVEEGYTIVKILAPAEVRLERLNAGGDKFTMEDLEFETEKHIDSFVSDYKIVNDGSLEKLYEQLDRLMTELGVKPLEK